MPELSAGASQAGHGLNERCSGSAGDSRLMKKFVFTDERVHVSPNLTAPLGGGVYLSCRYRGQSEILSAQWKRRVSSRSKAKRLAGFSNGKAFSRDDFSPPSSLTNLTVQMKVSSVAAEGEYVCEFQSEEEDFFESVFVTVVARPEVQTLVQAETVNNTHYQTARCSAVGGRPTARISWLVGGLPPSDHLFAVNTSEAPQSDGTSTLSSALTFPTHLQDQDSLLCLVHHPALAQPQLAAVRVETFGKLPLCLCEGYGTEKSHKLISHRSAESIQNRQPCSPVDQTFSPNFKVVHTIRCRRSMRTNNSGSNAENIQQRCFDFVPYASTHLRLLEEDGGSHFMTYRAI
uniref:Ig-like domain-containing protein n=1 Tax=Salarias fasciatus TaxID=181472 RepID=A0A672GR16_SALFA